MTHERTNELMNPDIGKIKQEDLNTRELLLRAFYKDERESVAHKLIDVYLEETRRRPIDFLRCSHALAQRGNKKDLDVWFEWVKNLNTI